MSETYTKLCLEGGGVKSLQVLGALDYISKQVDLTSIDEFAGTSAGGMICVLLAIGYTPVEIAVELAVSDVWRKLRFPNVLAMIQGEGAFEFSPIQEQLETMILKKVSTLPTLSSLKKDFHKSVYLPTYNMTLRKKVILSAETHPDLPCITALRMTSSLPYVFKSYVYKNHNYIDGGVVDNLPLGVWGESPEKVLCICTSTPDYHEPEIRKKEFDLFTFSHDILLAAQRENKGYYIQKAKKENGIFLVTIESTDKKAWDFSLSVPIQLDIFSKGYENAKKAVENIQDD